MNRMNRMLIRLNNEKGMGTIEMVVLIAILVGLALVFKDGILEYMDSMMKNLDRSVIDPTKL